MAEIYSSGGYSPPQSYIFIDGGNLAKVLDIASQRFFKSEPVPVSWSALRGQHRKAFYYDAIPVQIEAEDDNAYSARVAPKRAFLSTIEQQPYYHVRAGDVRHRKRRGAEQKMVDVQFAVDALSMASRGLFSAVTLVAGDLDFKPLIAALVEMGIDVTLIYPPGFTNAELIAAADVAIPLTIGQLAAWLDHARLPNPLPRAQIDFPHAMEGLRSKAAATWDLEDWGICLLLPTDEGEWRLITEKMPGEDRSLVITDPDEYRIAAYAADNFGLIGLG